MSEERYKGLSCTEELQFVHWHSEFEIVALLKSNFHVEGISGTE